MPRDYPAFLQDARAPNWGMMRAMFDWNDARYLLAVADGGSTLAAGRALRVSQTTVARRVAALEAALGVVLFERRQAGYVPTNAALPLIEHARAVAAAAEQLALAAETQRRSAAGTVRLTVIEILAVTVLTPMLRDLAEAHPGLRIELDTSDRLRDLAAGEADVAIRSVHRAEGEGLVGRRVASNAWTIYCSRDYAAAHGRPRRRAEMPGHRIIGGGEPGIWREYRDWIAANGFAEQVTMQHDSSTGLLAAVRAGLGLAALPCIVAESEPELLRCLPPVPGAARSLWLMTHERVRHAPAVRTVLDFLAPRLVALPDESAPERRHE